ncbi:hypothetical protein HII31_05956 [Pseudocercospora fuligena]|uniref:J domain-containing protein n=1 Tax=Pseudocercospora fuligena TaxID=685502 RepID=A0A8H6VID8_9PEZI|nr:hypothetical protein HII31_05956 [Pseudocercospora fuligena]
MVKPDVKHNYYADLDLPTTASVDDVRKAYRKLALQYHPDRNAGKEDECVPRFQAIQAANEVLSDATTKAKYDADRRKAGLYPAQTFKPNVPSPGNPYSARSDFPPPPRRTQPGTWAGHRPTASTGAGQTPSGADRFTNFPRPQGAAPRKDPAADRTQQFRAWQNMNNPQPERPRYAPQPPPREPQPQARPPPPNVPNRPRMNRQDTKMPTEEQIRAGMRYGNASTPAGDDAEAASRQSAWAAFQKSNAGQPGMARKGRAPTTPKRPTGFDPNAPGSDERPATGHYVHRHKSADLTEDGFPPPPPGPPPSAPSSPLSPNTQRPFADPLRPFRSRKSNDDAPYSEANRTSTPYSSFSGEKTAFNSDGLRRSASVRDNTKLSPESATSGHSRARSVDPAARQRQAEAARENGNKGRPTFMAGYSSSSGSSSPEGSSGPDPIESPEELSDEPPAKPQDPKDRPKKKPTPPSARFPNGTRSPLPGDGNFTDPEKPSMQQKAAPNMYDIPSTSAHYTPPSLFSRPEFRTAFASRSTAEGKARKPSIAPWAVPSSISPSLLKKRCQSATSTSSRTTLAEQSDYSGNHDTLWQQASQDERDAFRACRVELSKICGDIKQLNQFDLDTFRKAVRVVLQAGSTGTRTVDSIFANIISQYPSIAQQDSSKKPADSACSTYSFTIPVDHETFQPTRGKSRSVEEINTNFSPEPFAGKFQGSGDYFAPSPNGRRPSPSLRSGSSRAQRANTTDSTPASKPSSPMPPPPRTFVQEPDEQGSRPPSMYGTPVDGKFNPDHWSEALKDAHSWAVPGPPPNPPLSKAPSRKGSRPSSKSQPGPTLGTDKSPHVVDDNDDVVEVDRNGHPIAAGGAADDGDAMDIDTPPRPTDTTEQATPLSSSAKEPRLYSVPPSQWRQEQAQSYSHNRQTSSSSRRAQRKSGETDLKTNLDSLRHTITLEGGKEGLNELADLSSSLPYASKASSTLPIEVEDPPEVKLPQYPKAPSGPAKLTKASWTEYAQKFANYLLGHHMWNRSMLEHFNRREPQAEACMSRGTDWLSASGDTVNGAPGFGQYCKAVKQDQKWRTAWQVGCDKHLQNVNDFEQLRSRVKQSAENGILPDA